MKSNPRTIFTYSLLLAWLTISLIFFLYISRISYVPIVMITGWSALAEALVRISPLSYLLDLLGAFLGILLFSLTCITFGFGILGKEITSHSSKLAVGVTAFLIGEILFSLIFLTLISVYRLTPVLVVITSLLGFFLGFSTFKRFIAELRLRFNLSVLKQSERIILTLSVIALFLGLF